MRLPATTTRERATDAGESMASLVSSEAIDLASASQANEEGFPRTALHCTDSRIPSINPTRQPTTSQPNQQPLIAVQPPPSIPIPSALVHRRTRLSRTRSSPAVQRSRHQKQNACDLRPATCGDHGWRLTVSQPPNRGEGSAGDEWNRRLLGFCGVGQASLLMLVGARWFGIRASEREPRIALKDRANIVSPNRCIPSLSDPSSIDPVSLSVLFFVQAFTTQQPLTNGEKVNPRWESKR